MALITSRLQAEYSRHGIRPEDLLNFIQLDDFLEDWWELKLDDDDLHIVELGIMCAPTEGELIAGTGGLRELAYCRTGEWCVKARYVYFQEFSICLMVEAFEGEMPLSRADRAEIEELIHRERAALARGRVV